MKQPTINASLVKRLVTSQFPRWKDLPIRPVATSGWDNCTFHLGRDMLVRLPSAAHYAPQVEKEHHWLPKLSSSLPLSIPRPLSMGKPGEGYPWKWSIYQWLEGAPASTGNISNMSDFSRSLAEFLIALHYVDPTDGPLPGPDNFYRGGSLSVYDNEIRQALARLKGKINTKKALEIWEIGLRSTWTTSPVWLHGDISRNNLLVNNGKLSAVIDFGQLAVGDPACDLMIVWTFFKGTSRDTFCSLLPLDPGTWERARAWTLWKAAVIKSGLTKATASETAHCSPIINEVLTHCK